MADKPPPSSLLPLKPRREPAPTALVTFVSDPFTPPPSCTIAVSSRPYTATAQLRDHDYLRLTSRAGTVNTSRLPIMRQTASTSTPALVLAVTVLTTPSR